MSSQTTGEARTTEPTRFGPHPGPQTDFLTTPADIGIYGGEYGGGKTFDLWYDVIRHIHTPGFGGVIFRREAVDLTGPDSLWEQSEPVYRDLGGRGRTGQYMDWRWPSGAILKFSHLQHEKDKYSHRGLRYAYIGFDQLEQFTETQFWYLYSRAGSTCGVKPYIRATCNPDPDSFVRKLVDWWIDPRTGHAIPERSGIIRWFIREGDELVWSDDPDTFKETHPDNEMEPKSFTFIHARLEDNPTLNEKDPGYRSRIMALDTVERERGFGNWNIRPAAGLYFQRAWIEIVDAPPRELVKVTRGWDLAASQVSSTNPDPAFTAGLKMGRMPNGRAIVLDLVHMRGSPGEVQATVKNTAITDGASCSIAMWQDPGQAGKEQALFYSRAMQGYACRFEVASKDKVTYASPFSSLCENGYKTGEPVLVLRGPWNETFFNEWESFPEGKKKDIVDATSRAFMELTSGVGTPKIHSGAPRVTAGLFEQSRDGGRKRVRW